MNASIEEQSDYLVLLAEDDDAVAKSTIRFLEKTAYRVIRVADGVAAIQATLKQIPDIILMDVQMPKLDGLEAIKRIREYEHLNTIPIIALTGLAMHGDNSRCIGAGADHYLNKPYRIQELMDLMQQHLQTESV